MPTNVCGGARCAAAPGGSLRLTRRGRGTLVLAVVVLVLAAFAGAGTRSAASSAAGEGPRTVTVASGQTLWDVARQVAPDVDPRVTVRRLMELNRLISPRLLAGQALLVPR